MCIFDGTVTGFALASPEFFGARVVQRLLALNACTWHNWQISAPVKRSVIACDH